MDIQDSNKKGTLETFSRKGRLGVIKKKKNINEMLKDRALVIPDIFKCIYDNVLPFNLVRNSLFVQMLNFFAKYERGLKPPTYHELRVSYLKNAIVNIQASLNKYKVKWDK